MPALAKTDNSMRDAQQNAAHLARAFQARHPELAWSNRSAKDEVLIYAALKSGQFLVLLDAVVTFGLDHVSKNWTSLLTQPSMESRFLRDRVSNMLENIKRGHQQAT